MAVPERVDCFGSNKVLGPGCHSLEECLYVQHHLNFISVHLSQPVIHPTKDNLREKDHPTVSLYRSWFWCLLVSAVS